MASRERGGESSPRDELARGRARGGGPAAEEAALAGTPAQRDEQAVRRFVERFAAGLVQAGVPPMPARVFATLLATDSGRLTAAELAAQLNASPAAISGAVRYLELLGMIGREREPGSRRAQYAVFDDAWYEASVRQDQALTRWVAAAREGIEVLGPSTPAGQRMVESLDFFLFLQQETVELMARWRAHLAARNAAGQG